MSKALRYFLFIGVVFWCLNGYSQPLGLLPPKVKWYQLTSDSLRMIYPEGQEATARRTASLMLKEAALDPITTSGRYKRISILLQPQTNISNGYIGLAPYKGEFYLQSNENPFELGSMPWADLLSLHEYRHVLQVNAANTGISHLVKFIFGEYIFTGLYNLSVPNWYREGDAVYSETKWSSQGRGRLSHFTLPFKEKMKSGKPWNYYVLRNGSYRQFIPDYYPLGYLMVQYGNHVFGESTWDTIMSQAPRFKHLLNPFSGMVKELSGRNNRQLYLEAMKWYEAQWKEREVEDIEYPMLPLNQKDLDDDYFDMTYPDMDESGNLYATITTFDRTTAIYQINPDGQKTKVISLGLGQDTYFDQSHHTFVWTELRFDPRWNRKDKNVIVVFDQEGGHKISIEPTKGFYTPSLDAKGKKIVALHVDNEGKYNLKILDATSGEVLATLPNEENLYLGYPVFSEDGQHIIATARNLEGKMCLVDQDITSGTITLITHFSYSVLGKPILHDHWIFVAAGLDQLDQIYAVDITEGIFYQVSGGNTAHYDPAWDPLTNEIVCSEYRLNGKKLVHLSGLPNQWKPVNLDQGVKSIEGATARNLLAEKSVETNYTIGKYTPFANMVNVHSWTFTADDPIYGVEARSENIMSSITMAAGYEYNRNSRAGGPYVDVRLGMWFPELSFGFSNTSRNVLAPNGRQYRQTNERFNAGILFPFFFTPGVYHQTVQLSTKYNSGVSKLRPELNGFSGYHFNYATHSFLLINSRKKAYRQAMPTWGQRLDVMYSHELSGIPISQFYLSTDFALPAIRASHYLLLRAEYLNQDIRDGSIQLGSNYVGARGFDAVDGESQYHLGLTYGFPLWYPDVGIGNVFYTRRIRLQPFFDVAYTNDTMVKHSTMRSAGAECIIDFDFPPVSIGLRYSRLLSGYEGSPNRFEFFIPVQRF